MQIYQHKYKYGNSFETSGSYRLAFCTIFSLFFIWAIFNNFNDVLIKQFQKALNLTRMQSGLVQTAFYFGYFSFALPAGWVMQRVGYKRGILIGLGLAAFGALLFWPAAEAQRFGYFLLALYVIAAGLTFLETSVNPLAAVIGPPEGAAFRLNLGASFNGLGTAIAPTLGGMFIFSGVEYSHEAIERMPPGAQAAWRASEALAVQMPYLVLAGVMLVLMAIVYFIPFPSVEEENRASGDAGAGQRLLRSPAFLFAVVAQFFYVGTQVGVWSYFINLAQDLTHIGEKEAAYALTLSLSAFMLGRFAGTALIRRFSPALMLAVFGAAGMGLCVAAMILRGTPAVVACGASSFFMSICYPTIFSFGVKGLGARTKLASACLVMSIIGGAIFPPLMGWIIQVSGKVQDSLIMPVIGFGVVAVFGMAMRGRERINP